jgi:hypothetical protein
MAEYVSSLTDIAPVRDYLNRVGATARGLRSAVVMEVAGKYWRDLAIIKFDKDGGIRCSSMEYAPTEEERAQISEAWAVAKWPTLKPIKRVKDPPEMAKNAAKEDVFEFRNEDGDVVMLQVRCAGPQGKSYVPFTYWSDDKWRSCEADGPLPLYNADKIKGNATVFIHEGAKGARYCQGLIESNSVEAKANPWRKELSGAVHVGWIGGALNPYRTDWSILRRNGIKKAYIICDNDTPGLRAVPIISEQLNMVTFVIQFTDEFPASFDLGDPFPPHMFGEAGYYIGPSFRECLHPATWATDLVPQEKGKPKAILRECFKGFWVYIEEIDSFICSEMPEIARSEAVLNKMCAPLSHVQDTARLIVKSYSGRITKVCYRPDCEGLNVTYRGSSAINLHVPTSIKAHAGDAGPFLDFMKYMFNDEEELKHVLKWCATLIARPSIRMGYGLLLISEQQGIGKTTLGAHILAPLVGLHNTSFPGENDITSAFNEWVAHKRLAVISEIYSGSSWRAYHALKSVITDREVTVNQKYMRQYVVENWCHVLASSNSMRALKMENDDRRWLYPEMAEVPWPREKFDFFRAWLTTGGLGIIKGWAEEWGDYVAESDRAPMTARKMEMIEGSRSEAQSEALDIARTVAGLGRAGGVAIKDVIGWVRAHAQGRVFDSDYELRRAMTDGGLLVYPKRLRIGNRVQVVLINEELSKGVGGLPLTEANELVRNSIVRCADVMESSM